MGVFEIPGNPTGPGKFKIRMELDRDELRQTVEFFRRANEEISNGGAPSTLTTPPENSSTGIDPDSGNLPSAENPSLQTTGLASSQSTGETSSNDYVMPVHGYSGGVEQEKHAGAETSLAVAGEETLKEMLEQAGVGVQTMSMEDKPATVSVEPETTQHVEVPAKPEPPPEPTTRTQEESEASHIQDWEIIWKSDTSDHNNAAVRAITYVPDLPDLPSMDGSTGWLISASPQLLNLWGCNKGGGEASLQLLHSQEIDFDCVDLSAVPQLKTMFCAAHHREQHKSCVSVNSLGPEDMLAYKHQCKLPSNSTTGPIRQVVSLHRLGQPLQKGCAIGYSNRVAIWGGGGAGSASQQLLVDFQAHSRPVTVLSLSTNKPVLFTGSVDGQIALWNLSSKPSKPLQVLNAHSKMITGVEQVEQHMIVTASLDGKALVWDLRYTEQPVNAVTPDSTGIHKMAVSPINDSAILCTASSMYMMNLIDLNAKLNVMLDGPMERPFQCLTWNRQTLEVYGGGADGSIAVFRHSG